MALQAALSVPIVALLAPAIGIPGITISALCGFAVCDAAISVIGITVIAFFYTAARKPITTGRVQTRTARAIGTGIVVVAVTVIAGLTRRSVDSIVAADDIGAVGITGCALAFIVTDLASNWIGVTIAADGIGTIAVAAYALAAGIALLGSAIGIPGITITAAGTLTRV